MPIRAILWAWGATLWLGAPASLWAQAYLTPRSPASGTTAARVPATPSTAAAADQPAQTQVRRSIGDTVQWDVLGRSHGGRVIEYAQYGAGPRQVLVIGSMVGNEPEGVAMAEMLASHLARFPQRLTNVTVTVVRDPNPDGRAKRTAANGRGVDLDQNFRTSGWRRVAEGESFVTGNQPESEPETRALVELLADVKPDRVLLLRTAPTTPTLTFTGPAGTLARVVAGEAEMELVSPTVLQVPGSLAMLTGTDRGVPTLCFGFVPRPSADEIWSRHKSGLMTAIGCGTPTEFPAVPYGDQTPAAPGGDDRSRTNVVRRSVASVSGATSTTTIAPEPRRVVEPEPLTFQELKEGRPAVEVVSPRAASGASSTVPPRPDSAAVDSPTPSRTQTQVATSGPADPWRPAITSSNPYLPIRRLPPVDASATPQTSPARNGNLPQRPIPVYPDTGLR